MLICQLFMNFSNLFRSKLRIFLFSTFLVITILILSLSLVIANKSGKFLQIRDIYSDFGLEDREKNIKLDELVANFEPNEKTQIVNSDKCNLQIKLPKNLESQKIELNQNDKLNPNKNNSDFDNTVRSVMAGGERIPKKEIVESGDILQTFNFLPNQELKIICADKQIILDIIKDEESEHLKRNKKSLQDLHNISLGGFCPFTACPTFWQQMNFYLTYLFGQNQKTEKQFAEILETNNPYKFYNLTKNQLGELVDWDIKNSELENIKIIEETGYTPGINFQIRAFNLYFTHLDKGYWINFSISKNLSETELLKAIKDFQQAEKWNFGFEYQKDKITGLFAKQINLRFKK